MNDLPPSRVTNSTPPASCLNAIANFISGSVQSPAYQSTCWHFLSTVRHTSESAEPRTTGPP
ncbi:MAG: hypothetical protein J0I06_06310 [Planctomycetes bacterium]|nr:hypothetical protein [Planctomycetota bacterium]